MSAVEDAEDYALPTLREELKLVEGPSALDGSPTWTIFDPVRNNYFNFGWKTFQLISRWSAGTAKALLDKVSSETVYKARISDLEELIKFLYQNELTLRTKNNDYHEYLLKDNLTQSSKLQWLIKNYLFFRIPLFNPSKLLRLLKPLTDPLYTKNARTLILILGLIGLFLVARQWDNFISTFSFFFNLEGLIFYFCALWIIKILHEFGHAMTAYRYGCKIPTMGVAFLVMYPMLYTDTSDAWKLTSHRQRLHIAAAGMLSEMTLACFATLLWSFLPDGLFRSIAFVVATTSWIMTLAINLNPFMRFDGYYILSDLFGVDNLQARSFALGRWQLRRLLFKTSEPIPEKFSRELHRKLVLYAWSVWIYRFFLFIGIALLVYYLFFKLLGIILFLVEIYWFIIMPIAKEITNWWSMRHQIKNSKRIYINASLLALLALLFIAPWSTRIIIPAILETEDKVTIHAGTAGIISEVLIDVGSFVQQGDILLRMTSPQLEQKRNQTLREIDLIKLRFQRYAANPEDLANIQVILQQLNEVESRLEGINRQLDKLIVRSPLQGLVTDLNDGLHKGRWINEKQTLAFIIDPSLLKLEGYISEKDLNRVSHGQEAAFIPDDLGRDKVLAVINEIEGANSINIDIAYLSSIFGGDIAAWRDQEGAMIPENASYRVRFDVNGGNLIPPNQVVRGVVHIKGKRQSIASYIYESVLSVLIRESGF